MKAPDKIYIRPMPNPSDGYVGIAWDKTIPKCETYIRKDISDEAIKSAEDHAYFAGQEKFREKMLEKIEEILAEKPNTNGLAVEIAACVLKDVKKLINSL